MDMINFCHTPFRLALGALTALAWLAVFLYSISFEKNDGHSKRYYFFNLITLGATLGVFFAADFFTLFFFFEIMSLSSFMLVAHRNTKEAKYASATYLGISIAGGMSLLMGLFIIYSNSSANEGMIFAAAVCMFLGFGAKAGAFPLHVWLPASYTEAPAPAAALLSAVLSKTADKSAAAGAGASVYDAGSHTWSGNAPAFAPKPKNIQTAAAKIIPSFAELFEYMIKSPIRSDIPPAIEVL